MKISGPYLAFMLALALCSFHPAHAQLSRATVITVTNPKIIGPGCTTAFYRDPLCKGVGVGERSDQTYTLDNGGKESGVFTGYVAAGTSVLTITAMRAGAVVPPNWLSPNTPPGNIGRNAEVLSQLSGQITLSGTTTAGTHRITGLSSTAGISVGEAVSGTNIAAGAVVTEIQSGSSTVSMSLAATGSGTDSVTFAGGVGTYQLNNTYAAGAASQMLWAYPLPWWTMGNLPDPDPNDASVKTKAQWEAKWCGGTDPCTNQGMINFLATEKGYTCPTDRGCRIFYLSQSGNDNTCQMNNPLLPCQHWSKPAATLKDHGGGVVIIRGGDWRYNGQSGSELNFGANYRYTDGAAQNPGWQIGGSPGHPLYIMAYPGEQVLTDMHLNLGGTGPRDGTAYPGGDYFCCVAIDGLTFLSEIVATGGGADAISAGYYSNIKLINDEFAGYHQIIFSDGSTNITVADSVFHDMRTHGVYVAFGQRTPITDDPHQIPGGDFDFAWNAAHCSTIGYDGGTVIPCADYNFSIVDNVFYGNGGGGFEPIHINAIIDGVDIEGNINSFGGGSGMTLEHGVEHALIKNNILFDNGAACFTLYLNDNGNAQVADASLDWITFENNLCWVGYHGDSILGEHPGAGVVAGVAATAPGIYPPGNPFIKNVVIQNNIIETDNWSATAPQQPFMLYGQSNPSSWVIANNVVWKSTPGADSGRYVTFKNTNVNTGGLTVGGNQIVPDPSIAPGAYTLSQWQALNPNNFKNNVVVDPQFTDVSSSYTNNPGAFNFKLLPASPQTARACCSH